ncbi:MAG: DNA-deoxyinosine glycosylase [Solobacterium sp.]|nr:DNA-deoxyinosine glycosylase [Solobacterium sp.]
MNKVIHPIKPIFDAYSHVLILGSFPSVISREKGMYYANPQNRFWKVLASLFNEEIIDKKEFCLKHHIALWDVIKSCEIEKSNDASITNVEVNDIASITSKAPIHLIITNGKKASSLYETYIQSEIPMLSLPSTSSANAKFSLHDLCNAYQIILKYIYD